MAQIATSGVMVKRHMTHCQTMESHSIVSDYNWKTNKNWHWLDFKWLIWHLLPNEWTVTTKATVWARDNAFSHRWPSRKNARAWIKTSHLSTRSRPTSILLWTLIAMAYFLGHPVPLEHTLLQLHHVLMAFSPDWSKPKTPPSAAPRSQARRSAASSPPLSHLIYGQRLRTQRHILPLPTSRSKLYLGAMSRCSRLPCLTRFDSPAIVSLSPMLSTLSERRTLALRFFCKRSCPLPLSVLCIHRASSRFVRALGNTFRVHISRVEEV